MFCVHKSSFGASPGAQDYIVSFNSSDAGDTTKVKDVRFLAIKADAADKYAAVDICHRAPPAPATRRRRR